MPGYALSEEDVLRLADAVRWVERNRADLTGRPRQASGQAQEVYTVRVTGAAVSGLYPAVITDLNAVTGAYTDYRAVKVRSVGGTLASGTRYRATPAGKLADGTLVLESVATGGTVYDYATATGDGIVSTVSQQFGGQKHFVYGSVIVGGTTLTSVSAVSGYPGFIITDGASELFRLDTLVATLDATKSVRVLRVMDFEAPSGITNDDPILFVRKGVDGYIYENVMEAFNCRMRNDAFGLRAVPVAGIGMTPVEYTGVGVFVAGCNWRGGVVVEGSAPFPVSGTLGTGATAVNGVVTNLGTGGTYLAPSMATGSITPDHGPEAGGTVVVIRGVYFRTGATVTINSNSCTAVSVPDPTTIVCTAPAGAGSSRTVRVTNPDAQFSASLFYSYDPPPFAVSSISPAGGPTAGGTAVTITGTTFPATITSVTVGGNACTSVTRVSSTSITALTPSGTAGARDVAVTASGYTGTLSAAFTYAAAPTVSGISPTSGPAAGGTTVTLTGTFPAGSTYTVTFYASSGGGSANATSVVRVNGTTVTCVSPAGTGINTVYLSDEWGQSDGGYSFGYTIGGGGGGS
jgi:hypothetical protein